MKKTVYICDYCHKEIETIPNVPKGIIYLYGCEVHEVCESKFEVLAEKIIKFAKREFKSKT